MARKIYPSDVTREQFVRIQPILESVRRQTKPRTLDLYEVFCAVLYVLRGGCQWRMLPEGFPKWRSVHAYFQLWSEERDGQPSILETVLKKLVRVVRTNNGRTENTRGRTLQSFSTHWSYFSLLWHAFKQREGLGYKWSYF